MISPTLCCSVTPIKWVFAFSEWLMYWTYFPPKESYHAEGDGCWIPIHLYSNTYSMISHVCDHHETYGTYYKKWRLEVTATLGKFKIAFLSRWVKNSWGIQKGSLWGAQVFHYEKMFTVTKCTNISLLGEMLAYVWPHTEAKADWRNRTFKYSEYSRSLPIPIESAGALGPGFSSASSKVRRNHPQVQCKAFWGAWGTSVTFHGSSGSPNGALHWRHSSSLLTLPFSLLLCSRVVFEAFCPLWETGCSLAMSSSLQHPE